MIDIVKSSMCTGCFACENVCPKKCITMTNDNEGFWYPKVNIKNCINCGICEEKCPIIRRNPTISLKKAYAAVNKDDAIRQVSSSGGVFTLIAKKIIDDGGVVFGAAFSDDFYSARHIAVNTIDSLEKLRGSKYLQSEIGNTYNEAKKLLDCGKKVLFTGTPCQIGGLKSFLGKEYKNLYTQDIICHGVPSPKVWKSYLQYQENIAHSKAKKAFFRYKKTGWKSFSILLNFKNNKEMQEIFTENLYMKGFLANLFLRPSCYNCSFKSLERQSDVTLSDFWGIENILPEFNDDKGTSLVFINTKKGEQLFDDINEYLTVKKVDINNAIKYNSSAVKSVQPHENRKKFFKTYKNKGFYYAITNCMELSAYKKIIWFSKKAILKIIKIVRGI